MSECCLLSDKHLQKAVPSQWQCHSLSLHVTTVWPFQFISPSYPWIIFLFTTSFGRKSAQKGATVAVRLSHTERYNVPLASTSDLEQGECSLEDTQNSSVCRNFLWSRLHGLSTLRPWFGRLGYMVQGIPKQSQPSMGFRREKKHPKLLFREMLPK